MKKLLNVLQIIFLLTIVSTMFSCNSNDDPTDSVDDPMDELVNIRLPQAVYDQANYTASYMLDTDQDGDDDIILGPHVGLSSDMLLINDGTGFFEIKENAFPTRYQGINANTVNFTSADFNGDGLPDILASTLDAREGTFSESAQIHLYLNNGDNTFRDGTSQITDNLIPIGWVEWIRTGDFNNDGIIDFLTTSAGGFGMDPHNGVFQGGYIYLNDGNANFSRALIRMKDNSALGEYTNEVLAWDEVDDAEGLIGRWPLDILVGDVDNDGDIDLVAPNGYAGGNWATFINISTGTEASFEVILNAPSSEFEREKNGALIDINGDGFLDFVGSPTIAYDENSPVGVTTFLNDGTGKFIHTTGLIEGSAPGLVHARQWLVEDLNGDGKDDLLITDHGWDAYPFPGFPNTLLMGTGTMLSNNSSNVGTTNGFTHGAAIGDIDGDGTLDILMNNNRGLEDIGGAPVDFFIYLNDGSGVFTGEK